MENKEIVQILLNTALRRLANFVGLDIALVISDAMFNKKNDEYRSYFEAEASKFILLAEHVVDVTEKVEAYFQNGDWEKDELTKEGTYRREIIVISEGATFKVVIKHDMKYVYFIGIDVKDKTGSPVELSELQLSIFQGAFYANDCRIYDSDDIPFPNEII